jgi:anti-sigma B factor antagonist
MEVQQDIVGNWQIIKVSGEIDSKTVGSLRNTAVALDLTNVPFMSSAGLRTLLTLQRSTSKMQVDLALIGVASEIQDTMKVTGFLQYFTIYESKESLP